MNWKQHPVCSRYWFSDEGLVARMKDGKGLVVLNGTTAGQRRYQAIDMHTDDGKRRRAYVHRVICELFNGPQTPERPYCRHLDTDQTNNRADNLAWGTSFENAQDGVKHGKIKRGEANHMSRLTRQQVEQMRAMRASTGAFYHVIAAQFGVSRMTAHRAITGALWS